MISNGADDPFDVAYPAGVLKSLRSWVGQSELLGLGKQFRKDLRLVEQKLRLPPDTWGAPQYLQPKMELTIYRGITDFFVVYYGLHRLKKLVIVRR